MPYATQTDVENIFGASAVSKWADRDGDGDSVKKAARIAASLAFADNFINDFLRGGPVSIPITTTPTPGTIVDVAARLAGVWLYEGRGIEDIDPNLSQPFHRLAMHRRDAHSALRAIKAGALRIGATSPARSVPEVVPVASADYDPGMTSDEVVIIET